MRFLRTRMEGPLLVETDVRQDQRGFFVETYRVIDYAAHGIPPIVQENHSRSRRGVVRGMHLQAGMGKLVRCAHGSIYDVLVDARPGSPTYGRWEGFWLGDRTHRQLWVPDGFAHGFCAVSEADVVYGCTSYYDPGLERGFRWDDPRVGIRWPIDVAPSARDAAAGLLSDLGDGRC